MIDKESKWASECLDCNFEYLCRGSRSGYSQVKCMVCGGVGEYRQDAIRRGEVRCRTCHEKKMREECSAEGFTWLGKVDAKNSKCSCNVCGHVDEYEQSNIRAGRVRCKACQITKYESAAKDGWVFVDHFRKNGQTFVNLKHDCGDVLVKVHVSHYLKGVYDCPHCQIAKYQHAAKGGWTFVNHFCENGRQTFVNLKHSCCDELVKVHVGAYLKGEYSCPHCMYSHFSDPSYFYVIQVGDIVKLGISNRPSQRYTQYGLPDDSTITEHLRIPLETKRDALAVESYAKQLAKDFKIPTDIAKEVFTKAGFNECYSMESLEYLLTI